jgi:broad specificity phosphatase PhoE
MKSEHLLNAEKIARDVAAISELERVRDAVAETIRNETKPGSMIYELGGAVMKSGINAEDPNVRVLEQLRKVMRVPDGENIVTHAKILRALADALIYLQK